MAYSYYRSHVPGWGTNHVRGLSLRTAITCSLLTLVSIRCSPDARLPTIANLCALHVLEKCAAVTHTLHRDRTRLLFCPCPRGRPVSRLTVVSDKLSLGISSMLYQDTISRFSSGMGGFAKHDAKMWHYRAYGGLVCHCSLPGLVFLISRHRAKLHTWGPKK